MVPGYSALHGSWLQCSILYLATVLYMVPGYSALHGSWLQCSIWFLDTVLYIVSGYRALYGSWIQCSILYLATVLYMVPGKGRPLSVLESLICLLVSSPSKHTAFLNINLPTSEAQLQFTSFFYFNITKLIFD